MRLAAHNAPLGRAGGTGARRIAGRRQEERGMKVGWINVLALAAAAVVTIVTANLDRDRPGQLLNVSYDPTRELFAALDARFTAKYEHETGKDLTVKQSHGGSS